MRVLVVEDDKETALFLQRSLKESGHVAEVAGDGELGLALAREGGWDVLIVDRMLPRLDGLTVIETLHREGARTPVLILSALGAVDDRVKGLRAGGDDYLTKPYAYTELLARVEALARRPVLEEQVTRYTVGDLTLDRLSHKVSRGGQAIILQPRVSDAQRRPGGHPHHALAERVGLQLRSADERHRRAHLAAEEQNRQGLRETAPAYGARVRVYDP
jgi:two-component system OmpR family response regulator